MSGFDPKAYLKDNGPDADAFDPKAYLAEGNHGMDVIDTAGAGQAALDHFANAAAMGYLPQLSGIASKIVPNPSADVDAKLQAQGFKIQQPQDSYLSERDATIRRLAQGAQDHPIASGIGTVAGVVGGGALASAALPMAPAATFGGRVIQGAKAGAAYGALANPGDTEDEIDPIQVGGRLKNAAVGAAIGGAIPVAVEGVKAGSGAVGDFLANKAALKATRALGRPTPTQAAKMAASGQDVTLGRELLDQGAIPVLGTPDRIATRVDALKEKAGQAISDIIDQAGDGKSIDAEKLGLDILGSPELEAMRKIPGMESTVSAIEKQVETLAKNGQMTLKEAQALRQGIDKSINFNKAAPDMRGAQEGLYQQRTTIRDAMNDAINARNPDAGKDALLAANRKYSNLSAASDILEREAGRNQANRAVSLTDTIAGAAGASTGNPAAALALGALNKAGRTFGNSIQARAYNAASKGLPYVARGAELIGSNPAPIQKVAQSFASPPVNGSSGPVLDDETLGVFKSNPGLIDSIADPKIKRAVERSLGRSPAQGVNTPARGQDAWVQSGAQALSAHSQGKLSQDDMQALMQSPKGKQLLIQASDLKPGSKAMQKVYEQIQMLKGAK